MASTLAQLATFITTKLSSTEAADIAACKDYLNARYRMIYDSFLWTESMGVAESAVAASATSVTISDAPTITFFHSAVPPTTFIDFPVAVRFTETGQTDGVELPGFDWMNFFQLDPNAWNTDTSKLTTPRNFINLPKDGSGYPRIKLLPVPLTAGTLYTLGKLKWVALTDNDSPCLRGIDNALLCYAEADMLERGRQYAKAQAKFAEGSGHVQTMTNIEKGQQQSMSTIVPLEEGYYDPAGGPQ